MERITSKSWSGVVYYVDTKHNLALEPCEMNAHQVRLTIEKLEKYENTGLTPDEIKDLRERDTVKPPIWKSEFYGGFHCGTCNTFLPRRTLFCPNCGQRLKGEN